MSYHLPRRRVARQSFGSMEAVTWPTNVTLTAKLRPEDFFGPTDTSEHRSFMVRAKPGQRFYFNFGNGESSLFSEHHLSNLSCEQVLSNGVRLIIDGAKLTAQFEGDSLSDVYAVVQHIEFYILPMLSVCADIPFSVEALEAQIGADCRVEYHLPDLTVSAIIFSDEYRDSCVNEALAAANLWNDSVPRLVIACMYYQQAVRLRSPNETRVAGLNVAEAVLNLSKVLEVLFGDHDAVRLGCRSLGLTNEQVESQIIPLLLARNQLDIAHPVVTRLDETHLSALRGYLDRAQQNVRTVLLRTIRAVETGVFHLTPVEESGTAPEKIRLMRKIASYLEAQPLPLR